VIREEVRRLLTWEERHRRLFARIAIAIALTILVDAVASILVWHWERGAPGSEIHDFGDAVFFVTVQLLTVSSQLRNPVTSAGRAVDVILEIWAIFVITAVAGSFGAFFSTGDDV
jgi:protein-S-isoprenylcysteine O-methyltransferase Ste14